MLNQHLHHLRYLEHIGRQVFMYRCAACVHYNIIFLEQAFFFQQVYLAGNDLVQAFLFFVINCLYTPAQAQLVDQRLRFSEHIQR